MNSQRQPAVARLTVLPCFFGFRFHCQWIFPIEFPSRRIVMNVLTNALQRFVIADDVFEIVALPDQCAGFTSPTDEFCNG